MSQQDAFDRWWEWALKPADSTLTIPAHVHAAVMQLPTEQRRDRAAVNEAVRLADPDAIMARHHRARPAQLPRAGVLGATHKSSLIDVCYATIATKFRIAPK
jgi:hypothetical protein